MEKWYFGDLSEVDTRVLLKQLDEDNYQQYNLNMIDHRNYELEETSNIFDSSSIINKELVYEGELEPIIISHLGMYLAFQVDTGTYNKDSVRTRK